MDRVKGSGQLIIAVIALSVAVPLSQVPDFTSLYVLGNTFSSMEKNHARYNSLAHSYKFSSGERTAVRNASDTYIGNSDPYCDEIFKPDNYKVVFDTDDYSSLLGGLDCRSSVEYLTDQRDLTYPELPFYETWDKQVATVITARES